MDRPKKIIPAFPSATLDDADQGKGKTVSRRQLVNKLNYINFQDGAIFVTLEHPTFNGTVSLQAKPLPCVNERLDCSWTDIPDLDRILASYRFKYFTIADGKRVLLVEAKVMAMSRKGFCLLLPESCREAGSRRIVRHLCQGIETVMSQNGAVFRGMLRDFNSVSFRVELAAGASQAEWIDVASSVHLSFAAGEQTLFTGECRIIRQSRDGTGRIVVLEPMRHQMRRFRPKEHRSVRQELTPSPRIGFTHPLIGTRVTLQVMDLSASGFSVEEDDCLSVLLPGLILPDLEVSFADSFSIRCTAQVVYRQAGEEKNGKPVVRCGLAVLDMEHAEHVRLVGLLNRAADGNSSLCSPVDMEALWRFFFESGFVSPRKYAALQENKAEIKRTFERLYGGQSGLARHFMYEERGKILGHMAMIRAFDKSWMIHHHAADKTESVKAGLVVLDQISRYVNDLHHLRSAHLEYVFCYYRPDNRFPNRFFGEFARRLDNPRGCSLDTFAYVHHRLPRQEEGRLPRPWELSEARPFDLAELQNFYRHRSGGLMLDAFAPGGNGGDDVARRYREQGFRKETRWFCLKKEGLPQALLLASITDIGLNMSNLTNCVTVLVLDELLPRDILDGALSILASRYEGSRMPVLLYPVSYAEGKGYAPEKQYTLWVLNLHYLDRYFDFCNDIFRHIRKNG